MNVQRKLWTSEEEDIFLRIWQNYLVAVNDGRTLTDVCKYLQVEFRNKGIDATVDRIKTKIYSLKRKYNKIIKEPNKKKQWKNFDRMALIMGYLEQTQEINYEAREHSHSSSQLYKQNNYCFDEVAPMEYAEVQVEIEDMRTSSSSTTTFVTFQKYIEANEYQTWSTDSTIAAPSAVKKTKPRRKLWGLEEEDIFLDVWKKYLSDLVRAEIKLSIYKKMAAELKSKGVHIRCYDINTKIQSFIRKFSKERNKPDSCSKWVHYAKVREMLCPAQTPRPQGHEALFCPKPSFFDYFANYYPKPNFIDCPNNWLAADKLDSEFDSPSPEWASYYLNPKLIGYFNSWCTEDQPIDSENLESRSADCADNENSLEQANENEFDGNSSANHLDNAEDACYLIYPENLAMVVMEECQPMEHPINLSEAITRQEQVEQFGSFITKELHLLNDDLLEEAKTRIFDIIRIMHMKQVQQN
ncbi:uncharacterized protein LOC6573207 [Drosophila mojavensis]|uniref:uncharacterized protein LOC6573207 n=1 Tax=Drosophila mojavensis TaxID=7230 RepID=UPI001CD133A0|nr:uncharacterized protein LOC6573207 [Drosophila mojavensis]